MNDTIRFYCAEPGQFHGYTNPRPQWIDTFQRAGRGRWQTVPPERSQARPEGRGEILHRTSEVAITTEGAALRYAYKYTPLSTSRRRGASPLEVKDRSIMKVPIDLRTGSEYQAELGDDYSIDHITFEMRCRCGKSVSTRSHRLYGVLDRLSAADVTGSLSLTQLERILQSSS